MSANPSPPTELSGVVAILNEAEDAVESIRYLGDTPVKVKGTRARPFVEVKPDPEPGHEHEGYTDDIQLEVVTRTWTTRPIDYDVLDQDRLNHELTQDGSVVRALAELVFEEINKLRVKNGDPAYTKQQFIGAMKQKMRA